MSLIMMKSNSKTACKIIEKNGIILIAGKGHEKYQEIDNERYEFDDYIN